MTESKLEKLNTFNTIQSKNGGYIALHNAFRHPHLFSKVGGHMPALDLQFEDDDKIYFSDDVMWKKYDPIHICKNNPILYILIYILMQVIEIKVGFMKGVQFYNQYYN